MKITNAILCLLLVAAASGENIDSFDKQAEAAIEKASHLRGSADDEESEDALAAVDKRNRNGRRRANQWLKAHNDERKDWQSNPQVMMKWSEDLKEKAEYWADELVLTCNNRIPPKASGLTEYGFNIAMKQGQSDFRTVDQVFKLWDNKMYLGYPNNKEMSQVLWKATEYVGCADAGSANNAAKTCTASVCFYARAGNCGMGQINSWDEHLKKINVGCADAGSADNASKTCTASVCFYARAGNCGMGQINSWDEHLKKINDERSCGPCPDDHPNCKECNSMKKGRKVRC
eukprot:CAMPEP_0172573998 /NCGR_PEP_ID=MMETSP1067-20121228/136480_1 /TAXON_ID=265564 ORGANISM="Thalassiosira punctigera, Strain Tpunct2005C2" /NCGR_SAMPLE_ID=MMETSP1067 /ASSEMBLY_ACC=CAM_ASM_000444 /LENGTH=288 /DNA_ID=CAMNT_0013366621 /DNA_START=68 /DNA_END=934 /DNA_ORIENTATION=-